MKNTLILWLGAFGFATAKHLGENNPDTRFYASEVNAEIFQSLKNTRSHPFFFPWAKLPENVQLVWVIEDILHEIDLIISVIPCQFTTQAFAAIKDKLAPWAIILNLSKWIDNGTLKTTSENLAQELSWLDYTYAYLAGGMIAQELVGNKPLWADIVSENQDVLPALQELFQSDTLTINSVHASTKNTELYAALKNVIALIIGYYQGQWLWESSQWYYMTQLLKETQWVIKLLWGNTEMDFFQNALTGDLIATCYGGSRNRQLWNTLWKWSSIVDALQQLQEQNKIAEWYKTLQWVYEITKWKQWFDLINSFGSKYLT